MAKRGRKPNQEVATLWDYRHAKLLLDALATYDYEDKKLGSLLVTLCTSWGVELAPYETITHGHIYKTIQNLARHCLEHGRNEANEDES